MWDRLHPLYLRFFGEAVEADAGGVPTEHELSAP
jgi:hypothetical protein